MQSQFRFLAVILFFIMVLPSSAQVSQVQYKVIYNTATCLYEARAVVVGASLSSPIPFPSQFTVVVPAAIGDAPFTPVSVNPPGVSWSQSNSRYAPTADPNHDFHGFSMQGGGASNAYTVFTVGTDILLFTFSVPHVHCEEGIRCFINGSDPGSGDPGMAGIDFSQSFKTGQVGDINGVERYLGNTGNAVSLPKPATSASGSYSCNGNTLYLNANGSSSLGCNSSVSYGWTGTGGFSSSLQNPAVTTLSVPATYTVSVTDANGCAGTASVSHTAPFQPLSVTANMVHVTCNGLSNGIAAASVSGGSPGYSYLWSNSLTTSSITGLSAGTYSVTITDASSCIATALATITQPDAILVNAGDDQQLCMQYTTVLAGNWPPAGYTGNWTLVSQPSGSPAVSLFPENSPMATATGLQSNETIPYVFRYTIKNNINPDCSSFDDMQVFNKHLPSTPYAGPDRDLCIKESPDNIVTMAASTPIYGTGTWTQVPGGPDATIANSLDPHTTITYTTAGTYKFLWTVGNGVCGPNDPDTAVIKVYALPAVSAGPDVSVCIGSSVIITGSTATGDCMTLLWTTGGTGSFDFPTSLHPQYTPSATDITTGSVILTLKGTVGCCNPCGPKDVQDEMVLTFHASPVPVAYVVSHVSCNGLNDGVVSVNVSGGTPAYTYLWSTLATSQTVSGLSPDTYMVTVTDSHGCTGNSSISITEPDLLSMAGTITHISCYSYSTGAIDVTYGGGTTPYSYLWSNAQTTSGVSGLSAGYYTVTVTDAHGCTLSDSWEVEQPDPWFIQLTGPGSLCCGENGATGHYCVLIPSLAKSGAPGPYTYQWVVAGGTISGSPNGSCIDVVWSCCGTGTVTVLVAKCDGCQLMTSKTVTLIPSPAPLITGPAMVTVGQTGVMYCTPDIPGHSFSWNVIGGSVSSGEGEHCITVNWGTGCSPCNGSVTVYETFNGCTGTNTMAVTILPGEGNLTGYITYDNPYNIGLNGVVVTLHNLSTGTIAGVTTTGPNTGANSEPGFYTFANVPPGSYKLTGSYNGTWGGNNATDALIVQLTVIGTYTPPLSGLRLIAADVNASSTISALDALYIKLRTIGSLNSYPAGDWKIGEKNVPVAGIPVVQDLLALCVGDVNGSFIPAGYKETTFLSQVEDGLMTVPVGEPFEYNIRSSREAELGAMTLFMGYDNDRFEVVDVISKSEGMKYAFGDGNISVAWADTKPMNVKPDDLLLSLNLRVKNQIAEPSNVLSIRAGSEFADMLASPYENFDLKMSKVVTPGTSELTMYNYPNPFRTTTTIVYTLPEAGHVKLVLTDLYGKIISTLADAPENPGSHSVTVDPAALHMAPGVYLYKIIFDGSAMTGDGPSRDVTAVKVSKMVFAR